MRRKPKTTEKKMSSSKNNKGKVENDKSNNYTRAVYWHQLSSSKKGHAISRLKRKKKKKFHEK